MASEKRSREPDRRLWEVNWSSSDQVVGFLDQIESNRVHDKIPLEQSWMQCMNFYLGNHYRSWHPVQREYVDNEAPSWRVRMVHNFILPFVRTAVARYVRSDPIWTVTPATSEQRDIMVSRTSDKVLQAYWSKIGMTRTLIEALYWMCITGNGFLYVNWDPFAGPTMQLSDEERGDYKGIDPHLGEASVDAISPFQVDISPGSTCIEDAEWVCITRLRSPDYVKSRYGIEVQPNMDASSEYYLRYVTRTGNSASAENAQADSDGVLVKELWVPKATGFDGGMRVIVAGDQVVRPAMANPYKHGMIPLVHIGEAMVPGRFWATGSIEHMVPLQRDYNRNLSQMIESRNMMTKPKWLVPKTANISAEALTSEPGEKIEYYPAGGKPEMIQPPEIPRYAQGLLDITYRAMQDIASQHDASQAKNPSGSRSSLMIGALQEADQRDMAPTGLLVDRALSQVGRMLLATLQQYATEDRIIKIIGQQNAMEASWFNGDDLVGPNEGLPGVDYFDVRVQTYSQLPLSRAATSSFIEMLVREQVLHPQRDRRMILKAIGMGSSEEILDDGRVDRALQMNELQQMSQGTPVEPSEYEAHDVHIRTIDDWLKSESDAIDPMAREFIMVHRKAHEELMAQSAVKPQLMMKQAEQELTARMAAEAQMEAGQLQGFEGNPAIAMAEQAGANAEANKGISPEPGPVMNMQVHSD